MAIAHDAFSNSTQGTGNLSWNHTPVGTPRSVVVAIVQNVGVTDEVSSVTYGGVSMNRIGMLVNPVGEGGVVYWYHLGTGIGTGVKAVLATVSGGSAKIGYAATATAAADTMPVAYGEMISSSVVNPSITLAPLVSAQSYIAFLSGQDAATGTTPLTNWTSHNENDFGTEIGGFYRFNTVGTADVAAGLTQTAEDITLAGISIAEITTTALVTSNASISTDISSDVTSTATITFGQKDVTSSAVIQLATDVTSDAATSRVEQVDATSDAVINRTVDGDVGTSASISVQIVRGNGSEADVYASRKFPSEARVIVDLDPPIWTQHQFDNFSGGTSLPPVAYAQTWLTGGILIDNGAAKLRYYKRNAGTADAPVWKTIPLFEWFKLRESYPWMPDSPDTPFHMSITFKFPEDDPLYSVPIIIPGWNNTLGDLDNPVVIQQRGKSIHTSTQLVTDADDGHIFIICDGAQEVNMANDRAEHILRIEWDPNLAVNAHRTTVYLDGVSIHTSDTGAWPRHPQFGWAWDMLHEFGSSTGLEYDADHGLPISVLEISNVDVDQLGAEGFESYDDPDWTVPNHGATGPDDADEGEIYTEDDRRRALLPQKYVSSISGDTGREVQIGKLTLNLTPTDDITTWRWVGRYIFVDTRQSSPIGVTSWKRQIAAIARRSHPSVSADKREFTIEANSIVEDHLNVVAPRAWHGNGDDTIPGVNVGFNIQQILQDIVDVADAIKGTPLGATSHIIWDMDLLVSDIGTLGQSLLTVIGEIIDKIAYQYYVEYGTAAPTKYGRLMVWAWELGDGTPDYTLDSDILTDFQVDEDGDEGPSQVSFRQNLSDIEEDELVSTWLLPTPGMFPTVPSPIVNPPLTDSISFANSLSATSLQQLHGKDNAVINGGVATHRWRMQNAKRRTAQGTAHAQDYIKPGDEVSIPFAPSLSGETWIVDRIQWTFKEAHFESNIYFTTSDWLTAVRRGL